MFPKFDNMPNKDNIHKPQNKIALNNFRNIQSSLEGMSNIGNIFPAETKFVLYEKEDIILNETITSAGTKAFNVLSSIAGQDDIEENGLEAVDIKKVKKLDIVYNICRFYFRNRLYVVYKTLKKLYNKIFYIIKSIILLYVDYIFIYKRVCIRFIITLLSFYMDLTYSFKIINK